MEEDLIKSYYASGYTDAMVGKLINALEVLVLETIQQLFFGGSWFFSW